MKFLSVILILAFCRLNDCFAKSTTDDTIRLSKLPPEGILLDQGWKFHAGDDSAWARSGYNDSRWESINPTVDLNYLPQIKKEPVGWFRIKLRVDSNLLNKPLAFLVSQSIASEIYQNGRLLIKYGKVSQDKDAIRAYQPLFRPEGIMFNQSDQVLAVRFSFQGNLHYFKSAMTFTTFEFRINDVKGAAESQRFNHSNTKLNFISIGLFLVLTIVHAGLFLLFRKHAANLYFSIATLSGAFANLFWIVIANDPELGFRANAIFFEYIFLFLLFNLFLFIAIHQLFSRPRNSYFWIVIGYSIFSVLFYFYFYDAGEILAFLLPFAISMLVALRIAWQAFRRRFRDAVIILIGLTLYLVLYSTFVLIYEGIIPDSNIGLGSDFTLMDAMYWVAVFSVPVTLSLYLSRDFAYKSQELELRLKEVQELTVKAIAQEQEKQQLLSSQNITLAQQVEERTAALTRSITELKSAQSQLIQSEKMASLGELTAGIAHEIQNPLNFVNNFSEVNSELIDEADREIDKGNISEAKTILNDIKDNEQKILHHGKRADGIVKGMLQHSRSSTGVKEPTDINALVGEYLRLAYHGLRANDKEFKAEMKTDFDNANGKINIIPHDIGRVLLNLYNNAFYAVSDKKKSANAGYEPAVSVSTKKTENKITINVRDNGNGMPQKVVDKIFQPFFTTKPPGQGTGLGLSLSYDIVKAHGGEIKVETKEGEFTEFAIQLPIGL